MNNTNCEVVLERVAGKTPEGVRPAMIVKFGLDVHAEQITVCRQIEGRLPQPAQKLRWAECLDWIEAHVRAGAVVHTCYEAGPCGYGLHRQLTALGGHNLVVAPQRWDEKHRRVKTDRRDARELCDRLDRYVRGNREVFSTVLVPTPEQEQRRALTRQRGTLVKERQRCVVRGHGLMLAQGVHAPEGWWRATVWAVFSPELPAWLRPSVSWWREQALRYDAQVEALNPSIIAQVEGLALPKGLGALTEALLEAEVLTWTRFQNRRQVGSYLGLCPGEDSSGERRRQGSVTKHGNPRLRHLLVEAAWRLVQWQPQYPPLRRLQAAAGARARKRLIVAVARRLAVDLWRLRTGRCTAADVGLMLQQH
jgi:transposase